jgi:Sulfotransferase domain
MLAAERDSAAAVRRRPEAEPSPAVVETAGYRLPSPMSETLPTFVIIGAQKCGTTALHSYLARHPQISMSRPKELDFFVAEKNWDKGLEWYSRRWNGPEKPIRGESSPNYTAYPNFKGVPERMAGLLPDAKLIFMVRDPVARVRSSYIHAYSNAAEHRPMREAVLDPERAYVRRSRYHEQLTKFLEHYPMERILLLEQDELLGDRKATLERVFAFLGARENVWRESFNEPRLETAARRRRTRLGVYAANRLPIRWWRKIRDRRPFSKPFVQPEMEDSLREELEDMLRDDAAAFRELTGRRFESWSI